MLNENFKHSILKATSATEVYEKEVIQNLWSGYGQILRLATNSKDFQSIVVKYVRLPKGTSHPRGWNTDISHERKIKSYQIEKYFPRSFQVCLCKK